MATTPPFPTLTPPTKREARIARNSSRQLARLLAANREHIATICVEEDPKHVISIPHSALRLLTDVLTEMAKGNAVSLIPIHAELTTQQAADQLNVSRPFLVAELERGAIPFRKVGTHRRIRFEDIVRYRQQTDADRRTALSELSAVDQELNIDQADTDS